MQTNIDLESYSFVPQMSSGFLKETNKKSHTDKNMYEEGNHLCNTKRMDVHSLFYNLGLTVIVLA